MENNAMREKSKKFEAMVRYLENYDYNNLSVLMFPKDDAEFLIEACKNYMPQVEHKNAVLQGLENMKALDGRGDGLQYSVDGVDYTVDQMIEEIKHNTEIGNRFSQNIYDMTLTYMGKFSQNAE